MATDSSTTSEDKEELTVKIRGLIAVATLLTLIAASAATAQASPRGEDSRSVNGQVVQVRQSTGTAGEGTITEIRVRTRQHQETWLRLGPVSEYGNRYQAGDLVRARVMAGGKEDAGTVRSIWNLRTNAKMQVRDGEGALIRQQEGAGDQLRLRDRDRLQDGTGTGDQARDRLRQQIQDPSLDSMAAGDQDRDRLRDQDRLRDHTQSGTRDRLRDHTRDHARSGDRDRTRLRDCR
jgi:hypothetical protein